MQPLMKQGDKVFVKHLSLWSKGRFVSHNRDGTVSVSTGKQTLRTNPWNVVCDGKERQKSER